MEVEDATKTAKEKPTATGKKPVPYLLALVAGVVVYMYLSNHPSDNTRRATTSAASSPAKKSLREQLFEVKALGYLESTLEIESCRRESERIAKCIVQSKSRVNMVDGRRISASASRWDRGRGEFVDLPPAVVNAGLIGSGPSEITILMPEGADLVYLSFR